MRRIWFCLSWTPSELRRQENESETGDGPTGPASRLASDMDGAFKGPVLGQTSICRMRLTISMALRAQS